MGRISLKHIFHVAIVVGFLSSPGLCGASDVPDVPDILASSEFPSLISAIRIDGPLDFCGEPVPLDMQEVRERLEKEMLLNLWDRAQVILWIKRSGRYFPVIEKHLKQNGLPDDLKYVAVAESALRANAGSSKGAVGFWQFIKSTGLKYNLTINRNTDERRNIFTSTEAAVRYFQALYRKTGSWTLSAAGYNMGEYGLKDAMVHQEIKDYYRLHIPQETQRYIFRILAIKTILSNPQKYGFHIGKADLYPPLVFDRIQVALQQKTDIQIIAKAAGTYYKKIKDLNPQLRSQAMLAGQHTLLVPKGGAKGFSERLKTLSGTQGPAKAKTVYVVRKGDSLTGIARRFSVSLSSLLSWNNLKRNSAIHPGDRLVIYRK